MENIKNPRIVKDTSMTSGQKVTWDCIWFGSYPQSEVKRDDAVYSKLEVTNGWNKNNDIIVDGIKYRRMKRDDATYFGYLQGCYYWSDRETYHYFKYEPIKWRVLSVLEKDGTKTALILSDIALDTQNYNVICRPITWGRSTIRSWLNGYRKEFNDGTDYSNKNFIGSAFNFNQEKAIVQSTVSNADNLEFNTEGGINTEDKIFLLSESEVYGEQAIAYGFTKNDETRDEARRCKSSDYAKAMGIGCCTAYEYIDNSWWWLRTPGDEENHASYVRMCGTVNYRGDVVSINDIGIRPALYLDLSYSDQYTYAGTVCSDGTVNKEKLNQDLTNQAMNLPKRNKGMVEIIKKSKNKLKKFSSLREGEPFIFEGALLIKIHENINARGFNAYIFKNSEICKMNANTLVKPVTLEIYYQEI